MGNIERDHSNSWLGNISKSLIFSGKDAFDEMYPGYSLAMEKSKSVVKPIIYRTTNDFEKISKLYSRDASTLLKKSKKDIKDASSKKILPDNGIDSSLFKNIKGFNEKDYDNADKDYLLDNNPSETVNIFNTKDKETGQIVSNTESTVEHNKIKSVKQNVFGDFIDLYKNLSESRLNLESESFSSISSAIASQNDDRQNFFNDTSSALADIANNIKNVEKNLAFSSKNDAQLGSSLNDLLAGNIELTEFVSNIKTRIKKKQNIDSKGRSKETNNNILSPILRSIDKLTGERISKIDKIVGQTKMRGATYINDLLKNDGLEKLINKNSKIKNLADKLNIDPSNSMFKSIFSQYFNLSTGNVNEDNIARAKIRDPQSKVNFDAETHMSINQVIPGLFAKLLSAFNGQEEQYRDYFSGKWKSSSQIVNDQSKSNEVAATSGSDQNEILTNFAKRFNDNNRENGIEKKYDINDISTNIYKKEISKDNKEDKDLQKLLDDFYKSSKFENNTYKTIINNMHGARNNNNDINSPSKFVETKLNDSIVGAFKENTNKYVGKLNGLFDNGSKEKEYASLSKPKEFSNVLDDMSKKMDKYDIILQHLNNISNYIKNGKNINSSVPSNNSHIKNPISDITDQIKEKIASPKDKVKDAIKNKIEDATKGKVKDVVKDKVEQILPKNIKNKILAIPIVDKLFNKTPLNAKSSQSDKKEDKGKLFSKTKNNITKKFKENKEPFKKKVNSIKDTISKGKESISKKFKGKKDQKESSSDESSAIKPKKVVKDLAEKAKPFKEKIKSSKTFKKVASTKVGSKVIHGISKIAKSPIASSAKKNKSLGKIKKLSSVLGAAAIAKRLTSGNDYYNKYAGGGNIKKEDNNPVKTLNSQYSQPTAFSNSNIPYSYDIPKSNNVSSASAIQSKYSTNENSSPKKEQSEGEALSEIGNKFHHKLREAGMSESTLSDPNKINDVAYALTPYANARVFNDMGASQNSVKKWMKDFKNSMENAANAADGKFSGSSSSSSSDSDSSDDDGKSTGGAVSSSSSSSSGDGGSSFGSTGSSSSSSSSKKNSGSKAPSDSPAGDSDGGDGDADHGSGKSEQMLKYALAQKGKSYSNARRTGPDSFDCSGLVWAAMKHAGFDVPSTPFNTGSMVAFAKSKKYFKTLSAKDAGRGDIVVNEGGGHTGFLLSSNLTGDKNFFSAMNERDGIGTSSLKYFGSIIGYYRPIGGSASSSNNSSSNSSNDAGWEDMDAAISPSMAKTTSADRDAMLKRIQDKYDKRFKNERKLNDSLFEKWAKDDANKILQKQLETAAKEQSDGSIQGEIAGQLANNPEAMKAYKESLYKNSADYSSNDPLQNYEKWMATTDTKDSNSNNSSSPFNNNSSTANNRSNGNNGSSNNGSGIGSSTNRNSSDSNNSSNSNGTSNSGNNPSSDTIDVINGDTDNKAAASYEQTVEYVNDLHKLLSKTKSIYEVLVKIYKRVIVLRTHKDKRKTKYYQAILDNIKSNNYLNDRERQIMNSIQSMVPNEN